MYGPEFEPRDTFSDDISAHLDTFYVLDDDGLLVLSSQDPDPAYSANAAEMRLCEKYHADLSFIRCAVDEEIARRNSYDIESVVERFKQQLENL